MPYRGFVIFAVTALATKHRTAAAGEAAQS
jgi:hypothetical protein